MYKTHIIQHIAIFISAFREANWAVLEPVMNVEVTAPAEFQGSVLANLNKRHAVIKGNDATPGYFVVFCEVRINLIFIT